jgi:hypothetical protein
MHCTALYVVLCFSHLTAALSAFAVSLHCCFLASAGSQLACPAVSTLWHNCVCSVLFLPHASFLSLCLCICCTLASAGSQLACPAVSTSWDSCVCSVSFLLMPHFWLSVSAPVVVPLHRQAASLHALLTHQHITPALYVVHLHELLLKPHCCLPLNLMSHAQAGSQLACPADAPPHHSSSRQVPAPGAEPLPGTASRV